MSFWSKIAGTLEIWFGLGGSDTIAIGLDGSGNMRFKDDVLGVEPTLTELYSGGTPFDPDLLILTTDGGIVYNNDGEPLLKENP